MITDLDRIELCKDAIADAMTVKEIRSEQARWFPTKENREAAINSEIRVQLLLRQLNILEDNYKIRWEVRK